jgi:DNA-binding CsgD family transcriptional regulator
VVGCQGDVLGQLAHELAVFAGEALRLAAAGEQDAEHFVFHRCTGNRAIEKKTSPAPRSSSACTAPGFCNLEKLTGEVQQAHPGRADLTDEAPLLTVQRAGVLTGAGPEKPFPNEELVENIRRAIDLDHTHRRLFDRVDAIRERLGSLTPREHDVLNQVISGRPNKIIAHDLNLSQRSIEMHRSKVMEKMGASSVAQLVRMLISVESERRAGPPEG